MKNLVRHTLTVGAALLVLVPALGASLNEAQRKRIDEATTVLRELRNAPDKSIPQDLWEKASCVAVIPAVKKAAFIVGGEYGKGLASCRHGSGWSAPSFLMLQKGSLGLQIGGESVDLVLLVLNEQGMKRLLQNKVTLGGEASIAGGPVGRDARAMTDAQMKAEMLSYSRSQGLFAGVDLTGGVLRPDDEDNRALYGREIAARDILESPHVSTPKEAEHFLAVLNRTMTPSQ